MGLTPERREWLASLKAREVVELLHAGETTCLELMDVLEQRRASVDDIVQATPLPCFERGRRNAQSAGLLCGLPMLIKATQAIEGELWSEGFYSDRIANESAPIVRAVEAAGGVVCGQTNVPEFAAGAHCFNTLFPTTATPYDARRTAGGSSGGAAAAVASRQAWLATGSDLGGSLRVPAAFCGVVGFRTTPGVVVGERTDYDLDAVDGCLARDVGDIALFLDATAQTSDWRHKLFEKAAYRVAFSTLGCPARAELAKVVRDAAAKLGALQDVAEPWPLEPTKRCFYELRAARFFHKFGPTPDSRLKPEIIWNIGCAHGPKEAALELNRTIVAPAVEAFFEDFDILATPATLDVPFDKNIRYPVADYGSLSENSQPLPDYCAWIALTYLVSATKCPAIVLPCGELDDGLPIGIQLVAKPDNDLKLLQAAAALEAALDLPFAHGYAQPRLTNNANLRGRGPTTIEEARRGHGLPVL